MLTAVVFQTLFLAARTGFAVNSQNAGTSKKNKTKTFTFIKNIITLIMSYKKMWFILALVLLAGGAIMFFVSRPKQVAKNINLIDTAKTNSPSLIPTPAALVTWEDEAGFSFQYPEGITIDKHPNDMENYANLTLTDNGQAGSINILMSDNNNTLDKWTNPIDTVLGGKDGKKNLDTAGMTIGVLDNDVLVTLKRSTTLSPLLESAWQSITDSWEFIYPTPKTAPKTQTTVETDGGDVLEEE